MLRKFFQMVFMGNDRKKLHIYTATVLGGNKGQKSSDTGVEKAKTKYISRLDKKGCKEFYMKFGFIVTGNDDNEVLHITSEDITEKEQGFLSKVECVRQVWGKECEIIHDDCGKLEEKYCEYIGKEKDSLNPHTKKALASVAQNNVLWIQDDNKNQEEMYAIAVVGSFSSDDYNGSKKEKAQIKQKTLFDDGDEKAFYLLKVPTEQKLCKGFELLNWVKTTICFKYPLNEQNMIFSIKKDVKDCTDYIAPDFTWYFSPPVKSFINYESSSVEVRWKKKDERENECSEHKQCKCPVKPEIYPRFTSKRYDNIISPVANKTTVNFHKWINDEMIGYRQKYRFMAKNIFNIPETYKDVEELNLFIDTTDEHSRGNRQYILGIFISFALAFGIDSTRLRDAQRFFPLKSLFSADTWWLAMIILFTLNLLIRPVRGICKRRYEWWRKLNITISAVWFFSVFCIDKSHILTNAFNKYIGQPIMDWVSGWMAININYYVIPWTVFILLLLSNILYVFKNIKKYHDPILSSLFGGDIL